MASEKSNVYIGDELTLFAQATQWMKYITRQIAPYIHGDVFEIGAGLGTRTRSLCERSRSWLAVEPDPSMANNLREAVASGSVGNKVEVFQGTLQEISPDRFADVILYVDVLEHIESDRDELLLAASKLRPGGYLIVLSPAHQWLYTAFDQRIGHFRRYTLNSLRLIEPASMSIARRRMLDSVGLLASGTNRLFLKSSMPTRSQVQLWDKVMVPISVWLDKVTRYRVGKSVLVVWKK